MSSYKERQEERARKAKVAGSRSRGDARKKMSEYMGKFKAKMGGLRDRMSQPPQQRFGTSALQQAMAQQAMANKGQGVVTPEAQEMVNYHWERNPDEMARQFGQMKQFGGQGMHGDYGINRMAQPMYADASNSEANMSGSVEQENQAGVDQRLLLDRMMKDPSKLNAEGIKSMQTTLNSLGFRDNDGNMLDVDGKMGKLTASAMENYRGQLGQGVPENNEPLEPVDYHYRDARLADHTDSSHVNTEPKKWDPFGIVSAGYDQPQQTIGNPANDPVMWGSEELDSLTNPLQYDFEQGVPYRPKN